MKLEIKSIDEEKAVVAGYGVIFDSLDLEQEYFDKNTEFMLDLVPEKPVLYDHMGTNKKMWIGKVVKAQTDDIGLWVEAQIDRSKEYAEYVLDLIKDGRLGWSSGSVGHMVERLEGLIKQWPIVEFSLTPTPAEPRTLGVQQIKSVFSAMECEVPGALELGEAEHGDEQKTDEVNEEVEQCLNKLKETKLIPLTSLRPLSTVPLTNAKRLRKPKRKGLPN